MGKSLDEVSKILVTEYRSGYQDGISEGYQAAERILVWWLSNHKLIKPHSIETLEQWSRDALKDLRAKQEKAKC